MSYELLATSQCFPPAVDFVSGAYAGTEYRGTRETARTNQWFGGDFSNDAGDRKRRTPHGSDRSASQARQRSRLSEMVVARLN